MVTATQTLKLKLVIPDHITINLMPPVPRRLTVGLPITAFLSNESSKPVDVSAPTPCDVTYWTVKDSGGKTVESSRPEICNFVMQNRTIEPNETLRHDDVAELNAHVLVPGEEYTVEYHYWGVVEKAKFNVRIVM